MDRRTLMRGGLATALLAPGLARATEPALIAIRTDPAQVFRTTVCLRPFRAAGPRIEAETVGRKQVIHNYGHGGSGWSLSWGSADVAVGLAMQSSPRKVAVIGAGALGLTAAITAQRAGAEVTIYAKERFPFVRSARATGIWSPDSRVAQTATMPADFPVQWERMARTSAAMHESFVGSAGNPVEWMDYYTLRDPEPEPAITEPAIPEPFDPGFAYLNDRLRGLMPAYGSVAPETTPFAATQVRRGANLTFNIADYGRQLEADFLLAGGRFEHAEFHAPSDLSKLKEKVIINCTGYGARALWKDESIVPIRGQIVWLAPQEGVHYGCYRDGIGVLARRDGIVVQDFGPDEAFGWNDANETVDPLSAQATLEKLKAVYRA
ncbi:FAD-dependent oxidoreductase [Asticcacaulis sp.]|uniref:FAD-dependent oxidoreductase n=1 Tax=Asticcacaulis sp. TaxID=1872648 RepID=UPI002CC9C947|nr:FAD-dependent oxidoreductase [Asticcacaulis sp.]HTM79713.1 FAD-dependent oxidoreductase [Asticcacaulis sp.]